MKSSILTKAALIVAVGGWSFAIAPVTMAGYLWDGAPVAAASAASGILTKEQVTALIKQLPIPLAGYEWEESTVDDSYSFDRSGPVWTSYWGKVNDTNRKLMVDVDAKTGKLVQFHQIRYDRQSAADIGTISRKEAEKTAVQFIQRIAAEESGHVSRPNEYAQDADFHNRITDHVFVFTRMEHGIPFLENSLEVIVDSRGEIISYKRIWYDGQLPAPVPAMTAEEAKRKWEEAVQPRLAYVNAGDRIGMYGLKQKRSVLAYEYDEKAPVAIDAMSKQPLTILGEVVSVNQEAKIVPLGKSVRPAAAAQPKKLEEYELRERTDTIARTVFGAKPDRHSAGMSTMVYWTANGGDASSSSATLFSYALPRNGAGAGDKFHLGVNESGEILQYLRVEDDPQTEKRAYLHPMSYDKAQAIAVDFIKQLYYDRLSELYAIPLPPTEESKSSLFQRSGGYYIAFGWLKHGIPVEQAEAGVTVNPETGEVTSMLVLPTFQDIAHAPDKKAAIDAQQAKQAEKQHRELQLTYFLPHPEWRQGSYLVKPAPKLVYRMVGDDGVVDADSGTWVSFTAYKQSNIPQDISSHPQRQALLHAVEVGYFPVIDGKFDPALPVTRGEFLRVLLRVTELYGFHRSEEEQGKDSSVFADVDESHPLYGKVLAATKIGLLRPSGVREMFYPDRPITGKEATSMAADLLRLDESKRASLLAKAAVQPESAMTKADAALLLVELEAYAKSNGAR